MCGLPALTRSSQSDFVASSHSGILLHAPGRGPTAWPVAYELKKPQHAVINW
jgi:hypothetical protein